MVVKRFANTPLFASTHPKTDGHKTARILPPVRARLPEGIKIIDLAITTRVCSGGPNFKVIGQIEVGLVKSGEEAIHDREGIHAIEAGLIIQNDAMVQHG